MRADFGRALVRGAILALLLAPAQLAGQGVVVGDSVTALSVVPSSVLQPAFYDGEARRDPFDPLTLAGELESGPRFETLRLTGVFLGTPGNSLIVLEDPTRRGHFLRVGERIGDSRLVQILPESAVFDVEEYGTARREVLRLERNEENP
jgi:hypothetical protein